MSEETQVQEVAHEVPEKFKTLVSSIEKMTVIELYELVKTLEKKFGVSAQAVAVAGPAADAASGHKLFEAAVKAYRQDDCRTALELLDRYLTDNSGSPLAADAQLYKAECYLKLSAQ